MDKSILLKGLNSAYKIAHEKDYVQTASDCYGSVAIDSQSECEIDREDNVIFTFLSSLV